MGTACNKRWGSRASEGLVWHLNVRVMAGNYMRTNTSQPAGAGPLPPGAGGPFPAGAGGPLPAGAGGPLPPGGGGPFPLPFFGVAASSFGSSLLSSFASPGGGPLPFPPGGGGPLPWANRSKSQRAAFFAPSCIWARCAQAGSKSMGLSFSLSLSRCGALTNGRMCGDSTFQLTTNRGRLMLTHSPWFDPSCGPYPT